MVKNNHLLNHRLGMTANKSQANFESGLRMRSKKGGKHEEAEKKWRRYQYIDNKLHGMMLPKWN